MSETIVVCPCGRRLNVTRIAPGKSGRCPSCGAQVRVPEAPASAPAVPRDDDEWNWTGTYDLAPAETPPATRRAKSKRTAEPRDRRPDEPEVPGSPAAASPADNSADDDEWNWKGTYDLAPADAPPANRQAKPKRAAERRDRPPGKRKVAKPPAPGLPAATPVDNDEWNWKGTYALVPAESLQASKPDEPPPAVDAADLPLRVVADGRRKPPPQPEGWCPPRILYPLRAGEGVLIVASLGGTFWVMGTLIPEYCLTLLGDGEKLGAELMGRLVVMMSALPFVILVPLVLFYWLLYLARVLVASAEGDNRPPRPPDRNFEGFLTGLIPWIIWLILGLAVGLLPLAAYLAAASQGAPWSLGVAVPLGLVGLAYALMALLLTFLHDDSLAANPWAVLAHIARFFPSFLGLCLTTAATLALAPGAFAAAFALRAGHFSLYIVASLVSWLLLVWVSIVAMHTLGSYCGLRKDRLKWQRKWVTWGVEWKV